MKQLDLSWWQWLAENRLLGASHENLLDTLVTHGFERQLGEQALAGLDAHPFILAARNHQKLQRKLESVVANLQRLQSSAPSPRNNCPQRLCNPCNRFNEVASGAALASGRAAHASWS